jgi:hypothetical protein
MDCESEQDINRIQQTRPVKDIFVKQDKTDKEIFNDNNSSILIITYRL